eukprot:605736-Pleurochrysis_carterae.AAC.1
MSMVSTEESKVSWMYAGGEPDDSDDDDALMMRVQAAKVGAILIDDQFGQVELVGIKASSGCLEIK